MPNLDRTTHLELAPIPVSLEPAQSATHYRARMLLAQEQARSRRSSALAGALTAARTPDNPRCPAAPLGGDHSRPPPPDVLKSSGQPIEVPIEGRLPRVAAWRTHLSPELPVHRSGVFQAQVQPSACPPLDRGTSDSPTCCDQSEWMRSCAGVSVFAAENGSEPEDGRDGAGADKSRHNPTRGVPGGGLEGGESQCQERDHDTCRGGDE